MCGEIFVWKVTVFAFDISKNLRDYWHIFDNYFRMIGFLSYPQEPTILAAVRKNDDYVVGDFPRNTTEKSKFLLASKSMLRLGQKSQL